MKAKHLFLSIIALAFLNFAGFSQQDEDGKIVVEITKEINGEKKTFKGEYNSTEEMNSDPNYREFAGDNQDFNFWFDQGEGEDVFLHLDQLKNQGHSFFKFFGEDESDHGNFFFRHFDSDSVDGFFNLHFDDMDIEEYREHMKKLGIEMEEMLNRFHSEDGKNHVQVFAIKRLKITDVDEEFGKKGKVDESNLLDLKDLSFSPNPSSNGRFKVRFSVPDEADMSIKVSNLEGKEVFNRSFDRFGGTYSEIIDLSDQKEGVYLLEITHGRKRLTKKIVIN